MRLLCSNSLDLNFTAKNFTSKKKLLPFYPSVGSFRTTNKAKSTSNNQDGNVLNQPKQQTPSAQPRTKTLPRVDGLIRFFGLTINENNEL